MTDNYVISPTSITGIVISVD